MSGQAEVTLARPGWSDQRVVPISPPTMSWRTDGPGSFECRIEARQLHAAGISIGGRTTPLKGRWLWWEHPTAGTWGGVVTRSDVGPWYVTITAEQFAVLLRKRRLSGTYAPTSISPGSLALHFLTSAERNGDHYLLTDWEADETGPAVDIEPRGGDLCDDVFPDLAAYGYQWRVRSDTRDERLFQFRQRLGLDKRNTVLLSEGKHLTSLTMTGDLWTVANSIEGVSGDVAYEDAHGVLLGDKASVRTLGRRYEEEIAYAGSVTRSTVVPLIKADLKRRAYPQEIGTADVVDADYCWADIREGDTVGVESQHANVRCPMEIDIRSLDTGRGVLTVAGRVLVEAAL